MAAFRNERPPPPPTPEPMTRWQTIGKVLTPGVRFEYLGVQMVVVKFNDFFDLGEAGWEPGELICEYVSKDGMVCAKVFTDAIHAQVLEGIAGELISKHHE